MFIKGTTTYCNVFDIKCKSIVKGINETLLWIRISEPKLSGGGGWLERI